MENETYQLIIYTDNNNLITKAHTRFQREPDDGAIFAGVIDTRYVPFDLYKYGKLCQRWDGKEIVELTNEELDLIGFLRKETIDKIRTSYEYARTEKNDGIYSESLQDMIDCREADVQNIQALVYYMEQTGVSNINYKLKNNTFKAATFSEVKLILATMIGTLLQMWNKKDALLTLAKNATTIEELQKAVW